MGKFFIFDHQDKGNIFISQLSKMGWDQVGDPINAEIILADLEGFGREKFLSRYHEELGVPTVLYPHGPVVSCTWNFPGAKHFSFVASVIVPSFGHTSIMRAYGCKYKPLETGWPFSDVREFGRTSGRSIVFTPIHPNPVGFLSEGDRALNRLAFLKLIHLRKRAVHELTVRYLGTLEENGLWREPGVHYVEGRANLDETAQFIRGFDLVVGHHTPAYMAVAMGIPTLMFGEFVAPHYGGSERSMVHATDWALYKNIMMYPLDLLAEEDIHFLVERATYSDYEIADWKARMIGGPFNAKVFVDEMEKLVNGRNSQTAEEAQEERPWEREPLTQHVWISALQEGA